MLLQNSCITTAALGICLCVQPIFLLFTGEGTSLATTMLISVTGLSAMMQSSADNMKLTKDRNRHIGY
jgi:hypothetical protein